MTKWIDGLSQMQGVFLFTLFIIVTLACLVLTRAYFYKKYSRNRERNIFTGRDVVFTVGGKPLKGVNLKDNSDGFDEIIETNYPHEMPKTRARPRNTNNQTDYLFSGNHGRADHSPTNDYCGGSVGSDSGGGSSCGSSD